jgi:hypothetical protein
MDIDTKKTVNKINMALSESSFRRDLRVLRAIEEDSEHKITADFVVFDENLTV